MATKHPRLAAAILLAAAAAPALAHHSFSEYDAEHLISLEGEVKELKLINPHSRLHIVVTGADGTVTEWRLELGAPTALQRRGVTTSSLPPGTKLTVSGFQAKDGALRLAPRRIAFADGREFAYE
jgi:hypothetical protein